MKADKMRGSRLCLATILVALGEVPAMQGEDLERWQRICKEAAAEQDPHRFLELTREILRMLTEKQRRLEQAQAKKKPSAP
jgi:hypothetical protein